MEIEIYKMTFKIQTKGNENFKNFRRRFSGK